MSLDFWSLVCLLSSMDLFPIRVLKLIKNVALRQNNGNYEASMTLSSESASDLNWWMTSLPSECKNITMGNPTIEVAIDASILGLGAVYNGQSSQGMSTLLETQKHINELELLAVYFGLKSFLCLLKRKHVCIKSNNSATVCYLNAMGGTESPLSNKIAKSVWMCCVKNEIWLTACHVPGVLNFEADKSSRQFNGRIEWQLQPGIFL